MNKQLPGLAPTHSCKVCGALWRQCDDGSWSLRSETAGAYCDNAPMGEQIAPLSQRTEQPTIEQAIEALKLALRDSKGWNLGYAEAIIRDAIDRTAEASATGAEPTDAGYTPADFACWILDNHAGEIADVINATNWLNGYNAECATPTTSTTGKEEEAFEQLCREHDILGTAAARQCEVFWRAGATFAGKVDASRVRELSGSEVSEEFDALSQRLNWNTLSAVNAAWHAFKCAIKFCERKHGIGTPKSAEGEGA